MEPDACLPIEPPPEAFFDQAGLIHIHEGLRERWPSPPTVRQDRMGRRPRSPLPPSVFRPQSSALRPLAADY
jgi:hypothetical protein